jgi:hypothetical protein
MAFSKESSNLLIVECEGKPVGQIETVCRGLFEILEKKPGKKVILIAPHNHPLALSNQNWRTQTSVPGNG